MNNYYTCSSSFSGEYNKVCDKIVESITDYILHFDCDALINIHCSIFPGVVILSGVVGQINKTIPYEEIAKETLRFIGYDNNKTDFNCNTCTFINNIRTDMDWFLEEDMGSGEYGPVYGYACSETIDFMPIAQTVAQNISVITFSKAQKGELYWSMPYGKCQVGARYENGKFKCIDSIIYSTRYKDVKDPKDIIPDITNICNIATFGYKVDENCRLYVNPLTEISNAFGTSGIKAGENAYGPYCPIAISGVGKSNNYCARYGSYMARYMAKNFVAAGACDAMTVQLIYTAQWDKPFEIDLNPVNSEVSVEELKKIADITFNYNGKAIINNLNLRGTSYLPYACFGQYGRPECNSPWEKLDKVDEIKESLR